MREKHLQDNRHSHIVGRGARPKRNAHRPVTLTIPAWQVKALSRIGSIKEPGQYPMRLIVSPDGSRQIVFGSGAPESLT